MSLAIAGGISAAHAQVPRIELPGSVQPGRDQPLPLPIAPESDFDFTIQAPKRAPVPRAADELTFTLRDIVVTGATIYPPDSLRPLYEPLIGHEVKLADIIAVAEAIEAKYRQAGYLLTRAYVPPQRVGNGVFSLSVVEGFVKAVDVEGGGSAAQRMIKAYLQPVLTARPLDVRTMERALLLANDIPGVVASGLLRPSPDEPGASDLVVTLTQTPVSGGFATDNRGSKFAGPWSVRGDVAVSNLFDDNDQLAANVSSVPDSLEKLTAQLRYSHPVGTQGMIVSLTGSGTYGEPGFTLTPLNVITKSYAAGPRLRVPLIRSRSDSLFLDAGLNWQYAEVTTFAGLLSHDQWRTVDTALTYIENGFLNGTTLATLALAQGLPILGASPNGSPELSRPGADTDFTKLTASLRRAQILSDGRRRGRTRSGRKRKLRLGRSGRQRHRHQWRQRLDRHGARAVLHQQLLDQCTRRRHDCGQSTGRARRHRRRHGEEHQSAWRRPRPRRRLEICRRFRDIGRRRWRLDYADRDRRQRHSRDGIVRDGVQRVGARRQFAQR
jgi:hemolysin activation/secretion protein